MISRRIHNLFHPKRGEIWMLHRVVEQRSQEASQRQLEVTLAFLEERIKAARAAGYRFVSLDEVVASIVSPSCGRDKAAARRIVLTFDDGYRDNLRLALPLLERMGVPFVVYATAGFIDNRLPMWWYPNQQLALTADELRQLDAHPLCTIGAHTVSHPRLSELPLDAQRLEIEEGKRQIEDLVGHEVRHFSYPHGDYAPSTPMLCQSAGFLSAVSVTGCPLRTDSHPFRLDRLSLQQS